MQRVFHSTCALAIAVASWGCARKGTSAELQNARAAYEKARSAPAQERVPVRVHEARQALERAERAHRKDPQSTGEKHLAYLAMRKAQMALQHGKARVADGELAAAEREYQAALEEAREHALAHDIQTATQREELERVRSELAAVREELRGTGGNLDKRTRLLRAKERELAERTAELEAERVARMAAEQRAEKALKSLEEIAKVRQEDRGLIITIGGSLLFKSAQSDLLPIARNRLNQVATALMSMEEDRLITVEGHTDSRGSEDYNMRLSIARAEAVRAYLIERGIEENRIKAVGRGESMPIADNNTAEGRANNRRVEIIVNPPQGKKVTSRP